MSTSTLFLSVWDLRVFYAFRLQAGWALIFNGYGDLWRRRRRDFHHFFGSQSIAQYEHIQEEASRLLLRLLIRSPEAFSDNTRL